MIHLTEFHQISILVQFPSGYKVPWLYLYLQPQKFWDQSLKTEMCWSNTYWQMVKWKAEKETIVKVFSYTLIEVYMQEI